MNANLCIPLNKALDETNFLCFNTRNSESREWLPVSIELRRLRSVNEKQTFDLLFLILWFGISREKNYPITFVNLGYWFNNRKMLKLNIYNCLVFLPYSCSSFSLSWIRFYSADHQLFFSPSKLVAPCYWCGQVNILSHEILLNSTRNNKELTRQISIREVPWYAPLRNSTVRML